LHNSTSRFLGQLIIKKKQIITREDVKIAFCPNLPGLRVQDLVQLAEQWGMMHFLPDKKELVKCGRDYIANIMYTLNPKEFDKVVK